MTITPTTVALQNKINFPAGATSSNKATGNNPEKDIEGIKNSIKMGIYEIDMDKLTRILEKNI